MPKKYQINEGVFEVNNATDLAEVFKEQAANMDQAILEAEQYLQALERAAYDAGITEYDLMFATDTRWVDAWVWKRVFMECVDHIKLQATNYISVEAVKAIVSSEEFNYDLYVDHFLTALELNRDQIVGLIPHEETRQIEVKVSLDSLGDVTEWGQAIQNYRDRAGLGDIKRQAFDKEKGAKISSKIWREKIYGVDREGTQVTRWYSRDSVRKDITGRYRGKYRDTVAGRLGQLSSDKAPFWYLIEHGNTGVDMGLDMDGVPYPQYGPTRFVRNSELAILEAFRQLWDVYSRVAEQFLDDLRRRIEDAEEEFDFGYEEESVYEEIEREVFEETEQIIAEAVQTGTDVGRGILAQRETDIGRFEGYKREWGTQTSLRDPKTGQWAKLPSNW